MSTLVPVIYILPILRPLPYLAAAIMASLYGLTFVLTLASNVLVLIIKLIFIFKAELINELTEDKMTHLHLGSSVIIGLLAIFFDNLIVTVNSPIYFEILTGDPSLTRYPPFVNPLSTLKVQRRL